MSAQHTVAEAFADALVRHCVTRMFGVPGGGSSLDVIAAAAARGIPFVLARTENGAVMMAGATAELSGTPGVALTTKGPGLANGANGAAYAMLDRAPVLMVTDGFTPKQLAYITHQVFDQKAMLAPVMKGHGRLEGDDAAQEIETLIQTALAPRRGPVHVELTGPAARREVAPFAGGARAEAGIAGDVDALRARIAAAKRPVVVAGLEACRPEAADALRRLCAGLGCAGLVTYKAKGTIADDDPAYAGIFTGGAAEGPCVSSADLIVLYGMDPVELILQPWPYDIPVVEMSTAPHPVHYCAREASVYGPLDAVVGALGPLQPAPGWREGEAHAFRDTQRAALAYPSTGNLLSPQEVVERAAAHAARRPGPLPRIAVDAGAHMFSATMFWPCREPGDILISNGLATMAYALPAGIAAALHDPARGAVVFTGDGGLLMCLGELATAAQYGANVTVVVFNDASLSLIDVKQQSRKLAPDGVRWERPDFAGTARGLGFEAWRADSAETLETALAAAMAHDGPALVDAWIDPRGYGAQLKASRG
ncbi:thiamine pyrophosphate-binding protein [Futiania mangrovi]|uniref:Thiamine pyrophosphate-binding protein n=1 Tax=Futiania mangrovi TaxID=2959716 RepID=A0A9J6PE69_9PROT|nr:thiamine pyrophosphate-binding protein [Futiania mangrovii]MCP1336969.1 thiamine pyrophosphate-binding protein [Futiania mangrovii]